MKTRITILALCAVTLLAIVSAVALTHQNPVLNADGTRNRQFQVTGKVLRLDPAARTVEIAHQAIPGFMPAMVMPFRVPSGALLNGLAPGDQVQFELVVSADDSWIRRIDRLKSAPPSNSSVAVAQPTELDRLQVGETVPSFRLTDQDGHALTLETFRGRAVLVTFIYTRCPLPNFCPLMSRKFDELQERFEKRCPGRVHLLSISIDPEFDRPEVLKSYAARYHAKAEDWTFATGTAEQIRTVADLFGLTYQPESGLIAHDFRTALISPDGKLIQVWKSNLWTPFEVERAVLGMREFTLN